MSTPPTLPESQSPEQITFDVSPPFFKDGCSLNPSTYNPSTDQVNYWQENSGNIMELYTRVKLKDLIKEFPEMGDLIVQRDNAEFTTELGKDDEMTATYKIMVNENKDKIEKWIFKNGNYKLGGK